jgi:hypothetical protein
VQSNTTTNRFDFDLAEEGERVQKFAAAFSELAFAAGGDDMLKKVQSEISQMVMLKDMNFDTALALVYQDFREFLTGQQ